MTTTKSFISKPSFWCTTLITLYILIHAKGWLNKLLPLPCLCTTSCWLKGNLKDCYAGHLFFFYFQLPSTIFYKYSTVQKKKPVFFTFPFSQQEVVQRHGAKATKKLGTGEGSLFSQPFACICIYSVISVVHQKLGLLIKLFVVVI